MVQPNTRQSELEIMKRHVDALFTHDAQGRLQRVNEPSGADAPRFFLGRTRAGNVWRFRYDLPDSVIERLERLCLKEPVVGDVRQEPVRYSEYLSILERHSVVKKLSSGPAYFFPDRITPRSTQAILVTPDNLEVLRPGFEDWIPDVFRQPFVAIVKEGHAVSVCCSVRITAEAHEAGVETLVSHREGGYASEVVTVWANAVRRSGSMPLYSTSWQNIASQGVARKLGLVQYGAEFHVT